MDHTCQLLHIHASLVGNIAGARLNMALRLCVHNRNNVRGPSSCWHELAFRILKELSKINGSFYKATQLPNRNNNIYSHISIWHATLSNCLDRYLLSYTACHNLPEHNNSRIK